MTDRLCRPENVHKFPGHEVCKDKDKIAGLGKASRKAIENGKMVLLTNAPRTAKKVKPKPERVDK